MRKTIVMTLTLVLMAGASRAQAGKPKVQAQAPTDTPATSISTSVPATTTPTITGGRTTTGRPADLEPRIPWLDDIGVAQSGGPEPLVPIKRAVLPVPFSSPDPFIVLPSSNIAAYGVRDIGVLDMDGHVLWQKKLAEFTQKDAVAIDFLVAGEPGTFYAHTYGRNRQEPDDIVGFSESGDIIGRWKWLEAIPYGPIEVSYASGWIIGDLSNSRRLLVKIRPDAKSSVDDVVTAYDIEPLTSGFKMRDAAEKYRNDKEIGSKVRSEEQKRRRRVAALVDRKHDPKGLPFREWTYRRSGAAPTRLSLYNSSLRHWDSKTQCAVIELSIRNPQGESKEKLSWRGKLEGYGPAERERPILVWFDRQGRLLRYLIPRRGQKAQVIDDRAVLVGEHELEIWEPLKR